MEQFILGMLQEQLGKFIVGFRKEMVNASLLNGKGEITDLHLNCAFINQQLSNIIPFVELDSVHISKVAFQVTSWTNLRKAPIQVDIEHISVQMSEPLHYLYKHSINKQQGGQQQLRQMSLSEMEQYFVELREECKRTGKPFNNPNKRGGYNLVDRIVDNLCIEIKSLYIQFQTWGKFKTRRPGPWTPPLVQIMLRNLRYCSVDEFGQEGATPEDHWAHNQKPVPRGQERTLLIFKKCSLEYDFGVTTIEGKQYSLLKGGRGVKTAVGQKQQQTKQPAAGSPTAAETVAALAELGGPPAVVEAETDPQPAAEAVAELALEESQKDHQPSDNNKKENGGSEAKENDASIPPDEKEEAAAGDEKANQDNNTTTNNNDQAIIKREKDNGENDDDTAVAAAAASSTTKDDADEKEKEEEQQQQSSGTTKRQQPQSTKKEDNHEDDDCNNRVVVQMAMKRRVRDGALLAVQIDTTLSKVEISIPAEVVPHLVHAAMGLQYCLSKDRGFEDPLRNENDKTDHNDNINKKEETKQGKGEEEKDEARKEEKGAKEGAPNDNADENVTTDNPPAESNPIEEEGKPGNKPTPEESNDGDTAQTTTDTKGDKDEEVAERSEEASEKDDVLLRLPSIALDDNMSIAGDALSVLGGETDNDTLEGSTVSQLQSVDENKRGFGKSLSNFFSRKSVNSQSSQAAAAAAAAKATAATEGPSTPTTATNSATAGANQKVDRAIIMLPNGLVIHEKISVSVTVDHAAIRGVYAPPPPPPKAPGTKEEEAKEENAQIDSGQRKEQQEDYIQIDSNGAVMELIWPKSNLEKGGYAQVSVSHVSVQERYGKRIRTVVSSGVRHGVATGPIEKAASPPAEVDPDEAFPKFEDRAIREDPLEMRRTYPAQAMGLVARIDCQTRKKKTPQTKQSSTAPLPTTITTGNENNNNNNNDDTGSAAASVPNTSQEGESVGLNASQDELSAPNASQDDNPQGTDQDEEEEVEVIVVTNDVGVDQMNVVLDCDCWCRALRLLLNESGGGFDGRWNSGDWSKLLTTDMLVHPSVPLELDDHLQPLAKFYLDDNEFVSSDLFHVNAKIKNCETRVPAAIEHNVRSCDIVTLIEETLVTVSSDLPRAFPSAYIGNTFSDDVNASTAAIKFPNDPSDVSIELESGEDPSKRQSYMMSADTEKIVKTRSTFRVELKLQGMSTQIVPLIPFYTFSEPRQLMAPTDMTVGFCFEGVPPETEDSNLIKMVLFSSVVVKRMQMNCDLELLAGATSTVLHHFHVTRETIACAKELIPMTATPEEENSVSNRDLSNRDGEDDLSSTLLSTTSTARIQKSLRGRGILVHRQLHRSRETGGLSFGMFLQVENYDFNLWRQNVSMYNQEQNLEDVISGIDRHKIHFPLLKLLSCSAKNIETGIEVSFPEDERRVVVKCSLSDSSLSLCDLNGYVASESTNEQSTPSTDKELEPSIEAMEAPSDPNTDEACSEGNEEQPTEEDGKEDSNVDGNTPPSEAKEQEANEENRKENSDVAGMKNQAMVDVFKFGSTVPISPAPLVDGENAAICDKAILIRCEESYGSCRARSFAADIGTGGVVNLNVNQFESVFLLVLEALMMPTWSKSMSYPLIEKRRFPEKSVGALFHALLPGKGGRFRILRLLRKLVALALPEDLRLLLLHVTMAEVLITIPDVADQQAEKLMAQNCALMLRHLDLVTWYISSLDDPFSRSLFPVVAAKEGKPWASLISQDTSGINHRLACRQSLHVAHISDDASTQAMKFVQLLPEFQVALEYLRARMSTTMDNTCSLEDKQTLRDTLSFLRRFASRCVEMFFHLKQRLSVLKRQEANGGEEPSLINESNKPISSACSSIGKSISNIKALLLRMSKYVDESTLALNDALKEKDAEVERLQQLVFCKEKERVAAIALASSPIAGWMRVGGAHQSGLRKSTTATLWRFWAVLRREILILYSAPGKFKPVDLVSLREAQLRVLSGGKSKWDLKRSFGIVEASGKTRFFVVGSDDEYNSWTREIERVIRRHTLPENDEDAKSEVKETVEEEKELGAYEKETPGEDKEATVDGDDSFIPKAPSDRDEESVGMESGGPTTTGSIQSDQATTPTEPGRFRGKLAGIGSFLKKSKQAPSTPTPTPASTSMSTPTPTTDNYTEAAADTKTSAEEATETTDVTGQEDQSEADAGKDKSPTNCASQSPPPDMSSGNNSNRRVQLKNRVAGVGGKVAGVGGKVASVGGAVGGKVVSVGGAVGGKVAGVGQATGRWGSALLAATRQKGRDVAERTRRTATPTANRGDELNASAHGTLHVITEKEERNWACPQCTFVNSTKETDVEFLICAICESPTAVSALEFEHPPESAENSTAPDSAVEAEPDEEPNRERLGSTDSGKGVFRRQSSEPLDLRERLNSADSSDPDLLRRTQSSENFGGSYVDEDETSIISDLAMDEMSEAARSVGRRRRDRLGGLLGSGRKSRQQDRPGESESARKGWFSRLGSNASTQDEGEAFLKSQPALKLKNVRINPNVEFTCEDTLAINVPLQKLDGRWFALVTETSEGASITEDAGGFVLNDGLGKDDDSITTPQNGSVAAPASVRSLVSKPADDKVQYFRIQTFHRGPSDGESKQPRSTVIRSFLEIVSFHNVMSECIVDLIHHPLFYEKSFERTSNGDMSTGLKNALGISPLDSVRISGAFLAGIVDASTSNSPVDIPAARQAEAAMEFLNSSLECALSSSAHFALTEFLGISNAPTIEVLSPSDTLSEAANDEMESFLAESDTMSNEARATEQENDDNNKPTDTAMSLSSQCMVELLQAEQNNKLATDLLNVATTPFEISHQQTPVLPNHVTENLQNAMHVALMKVMAERDEAHAQLVSASVLHAHNLEQERKKVERLEAKLELANKIVQRPALPRFGLDRKKFQEEEEEREKFQKKQMEMQQNSDAEIVALCEQLNGEISSRTQAALEVIRLKESRTIERKHEAEEKDALRDELIRVKEMLAREQKKAQEAKTEADRWKQYYERATSAHNDKGSEN